MVKNLPAKAGDIGNASLISGSERSPGETPIFLPGESHGQRSLASTKIEQITESFFNYFLKPLLLA